MKHRFSHVAKHIPPSGIRKFFDLIIDADDVISLGVGEPDFATPWRVREEVFHALEKGRTSYTSNWGLYDLRKAIADHYNDTHNLAYDPKSEILITVGVSEAVDITLRTILNPGDEVVVLEPSYVAYAPLVTLAGGVPVAVDTSLNGFRPTAAAIAEKITPRTKALFLCYPNNPTGMTIQRPELEKIAALARQHDLWVMSDEIYAELTYEGMHTPLATLDGMKERVIMFNGFSKAHAMTGWRIGYICAPEDMVALAVKIHQYCILCAPIMAQYAAIEAIKNCAREVAEMKASYLFRRNLFVHGMNKAGLPVHMPDGAFYAFPSIAETGLSSEEFAIQLLHREKVAVVPGNAFGQCGEGYIRCCYATDTDQIKEAIERIGNFVRTLK